MSFTNNGTTVIDANGNLVCSTMNCNTITNINDTFSFTKQLGNVGCYSIGTISKVTNNNTVVPFIQFRFPTNTSYGGIQCEFILCGTQSNLAGFVNKYECCIVATTGLVYSNNASVGNGTELNKINIGQSDTVTTPNFVPRLSKTTSTTSFANDTITFNVTPGTTIGSSLHLFYRILNGGSTNNCTITFP